MNEHSTLQVRPVTAARWRDLERLFGERGAFGGCWCMYWRLRTAEFGRNTGNDNKRKLKKLVAAKTIPGLLAYIECAPVAWVSIAPREEFAHLEYSRTLMRVDDQPVWSVVCFFVTKEFRDEGLMEPLLQAAVDYAAKRGAKIIEAYPVVLKNRRLTGYAGFTGVASTFKRAGFVRVKRVNPYQWIMRRVIE